MKKKCLSLVQAKVSIYRDLNVFLDQLYSMKNFKNLKTNHDNQCIVQFSFYNNETTFYYVLSSCGLKLC